ncbi:hypothetical protein [Rhodanobacter glycinis]|uniref:hypothetical protein n=1 Tax=Rhodanobacter glycinis TaxID=582702 RepID=UPI001876DEBF|nr:hypothetical protein [Rhodanobacter glycinis]
MSIENTPVPSPLDAMQSGIDRAAAPTADEAKAKVQQEADVSRWFDRIRQARKFDEPAREQYAKDRKYARGDSGFEVDSNLIGTYIDILESFLYARDPDVDVRPSPCSEPPSLEAMRDAAEDYVGELPDMQQAHDQAAAAVLQDSGGDQQMAEQAGKQAADGLRDHLIQKQYEKIRKRYQRRQRDTKAFAETLEIVVSRLWKDARLKPRGIRWVRSALTIGLGVLKVSWQERTAPSPETVTAINDLQANIQRAAAMRQELDEASGTEEDALRAEYERQLETLRNQAEVVVARGLAIDVVPAEDFQVAPGFTIADHVDAPWNSHRIPKRYCDAQAEFELSDAVMKQAKRFAARKPVMVQRESAMLTNSTAADADAYLDASTSMDYSSDTAGDFVMVEEIWDCDTNSVLTGIHGIKCWVKPAWNPTATTRFYPFFVLCTSEVDGQRHPQSLTSRSAKLVDDYNRIGSAEAEHRRRSLPGILFHKGQVGQEVMNKINNSTTGEWTGVETTMPNVDLRKVFFQKPCAPVDPGLYDRSRITQELERIWGVQEALSGSINTQKTATEADIAQTGFKARTSGRRDSMETQLGEMAQYTAELSRAHVTAEDAQAIAGPDAMWPEYTGPDDLRSLVVVDIRAGSSGKPDTMMERQAWANQLPLLQNGIVQIGQMRGSSPADIADALERLLKITAERSGDRIDIDSLIPQSGNAQQPSAPGAGGPPGNGQTPPTLPPIQQSALMGPQTAALTQILDQVRQSILTPETAAAVIQAAYPMIPEPLIQQMVGGVPVQPGAPGPNPPTGQPGQPSQGGSAPAPTGSLVGQPSPPGPVPPGTPAPGVPSPTLSPE